MPSTVVSKRVIGVLGVALLMLVAGCFSPPPPPNQGPQTTERPDATPYVADGGDLNFQKVQPDHNAQLLNNSEGFTSRYTVTIDDPRLESGNTTLRSMYQVNLNNSERVYTSNMTGQSIEAYQNSLLYYEKANGESTVTPVSDLNTSAISLNEATANSSLVRVGMNSIDYSLSSVKYQGDTEVSTYTGSQSVSNYALGELFPDDMEYNPGNPQVTDESISSTVTVTNDGLIQKYTFEYSASIFVDGTEDQYSVSVTYQVGQTGPINVQKPAWAQNMSQSAN